MDIHLRLPGRSPEHDVELAGRSAALAAAYRHGLLAAAAIPPHAGNPCEQNGCDYIGSIVDSAGQTWLLYLCGEVIEPYPA